MKRLTTYLHETLAGNSRAFNEVVLQFQEKALKKAYAQLGDFCLAEDAVQEAFITAYLNLTSLRNLEFFPGWFRSILSSSIGKTVKKNRLNIPFIELDESIDIAKIVPNNIEDFERHEIKILVRKAIACLSLKTQVVCTYFYLYGYSLKEIANFFDIPIGTVKRRLHDARKQIRAYLKLGRIPQGIRVGYMPISDHLLAMVSHQTNDNDHLRIELQKFLSWTSLVKALQDRTVDAAFIMATLAMTLKNQGVPIVYILDAAHGGSAITVRKSITSIKALNGTRLGLPLVNSTHNSLLHFFLQKESISVHRDIAATYLSPSYSIGALQKDQIDGFFCAEPWNTKAVYEGVGRILVRSQQIIPEHICCIVVVRKELAGKQGDILNLYLKQLLSARELAWRHPKKCSKIQALYTGVSREIAEEVLRKKHITFSDLLPDKEKIGKSMNMAISAGALDKKCDLDNFISSKFI